MKKKWQVIVELKNGGHYDPMTVSADTQEKAIAKVIKVMGKTYWEKHVFSAKAQPFDSDLDTESPLEVESA